jgi:hypothetical protein
MATVVVPAAVLFGDGLPDVCFQTGQPAHRRLRVTFSTLRLPGVVLVALLLSLVGGVIAWLILVRQAHGTLAASEQVFQRRRRARLATVNVGAAGGFLLGVGIAMQAAAAIVVALLWMLLAPAFTFALLRRTYQPRGTVFDDGAQRMVRLENVHPAFVAAFTGQAAR